MNKEVIIIPADQVMAPKKQNDRKLRVAAYCRVSTDEEKQLDSFDNQVEYFTRLISENRKYVLVKIYSDEGISGTNTKRRVGFNEMIQDCEAGKIDLIITKSISRFARNTQDSLNYTRRLKDRGIGIYFEKEGINTLESSGELLLTLFSCFAQEESRSISENTAWGIRSKFQQGIPHLNVTLLFGYDRDMQGNLAINEEQAPVVRRIFQMFLEGFSLQGIAQSLNRDQIPGVHGEANWCATTISHMLENEKYKGALLMQKTYTANFLTKQHVRNTGQLNQYYIENNHPPIIEPEIWGAVQEEIARRKDFRESHGIRGTSGSHTSPFYAKVFCQSCEKKLQRIFHRGVREPFWQCPDCGNQISEETLRAHFCTAFNTLVFWREYATKSWIKKLQEGTPLEKVRGRQMIEITAGGIIPYEVENLTQTILQEICLKKTGGLEVYFLIGDVVVL